MDLSACCLEESGMDVFKESYVRANIIAWLPIERTESVLYIGEEDMISEKLKELSEHVVCVGRGADLLSGIEYDYIICPEFGKNAKEGMLKSFAGCLKETGRLILTAENAYGLKYLAGVRERGSGEYFGAVEDLDGSVGYTKEELVKKLADAGFAGWQFYYPFPDHVFTMSLYSDDYLPKQGELIDQVGNFDADRMVLFDEAKAADALVARGKFAEFSSSYLIAAGKGGVHPIENGFGDRILFVKFSNDRGKGRNIRTYIAESADGTRHLIKTADTKAADAQIANMEAMSGRLAELYADSRFKINECRMLSGGAKEAKGLAAELAYLQGRTMEELMDGMLARGEYEAAAEQMDEVLLEIAKCRNQKEFLVSEEFRAVFGDAKLPEGLLSAPASDIDMILSNILVDESGSWTLIDYEWSFGFPIPVHFILYRCIRYYVDTTETRKKLGAERFYRKAGIIEPEIAAYERMEGAFQDYVLDGHVPLRQLYREYGKPAYHISSLLNVVDDQERRRALQIYFDRGNGFTEKESVYYRSKALDGTYHLEIPIPGDVTGLRIDPGSQACTVDIKRLCLKPNRTGILEFVSNGHKLEKGMYLFDTEDPNILLTGLPAGKKTLLLDLRTDPMSLAAAEWIAPKIDAKYRLKKMLKK